MIGLVTSQGLARFSSEAELRRKAKEAYRAHRTGWSTAALYNIASAFQRLNDHLRGRAHDRSDYRPISNIRFVGLWDTVAAYGLPVEEMTRGISRWLWPLSLPDRSLTPRVQRACHALSLDDERTTFQPFLWDETGEHRPQPNADGRRYTNDERISQVWFSGAHANVGGGYPDDSLAHVSLCWMMQEARQWGLRFKSSPDADPDAFLNRLSMRDDLGRLYDPRAGLGRLYRYGPRKLEDLVHTQFSHGPEDKVQIGLPKVHYSVFRRIQISRGSYCPLGLPAEYEVVTSDGEIRSLGQDTYETVEDAGARAAVQERAWDLVWQRKIVYFGVLASLLWLLSYPLFVSFPEAGEFTSPLRPVSDLVRIFGSFVPAGLSLWVNTYARNPALFSLSLFTLIALCMFETRLRNRIRDEIRAAWWSNRSTSPREPIANSWTYKLRTSVVYQRTHQFLRLHIAPTVFAATYFFLIIYVILVLVNRLAFVSMDAVGVFCEHNPKQVRLEKAGFATHSFDISSFCLGTGIIVRSGERYVIQATQGSPLQDGVIPAFVGGIDRTKLTLLQRQRTALARPFGRSWVRPWFTVIARVGSVGSEEFYLGPDPALPPGQVDTVFRTRSEGELFVYVNDVALGLPWLKDLYYRDNSGKLDVRIERR